MTERPRQRRKLVIALKESKGATEDAQRQEAGRSAVTTAILHRLPP